MPYLPAPPAGYPRPRRAWAGTSLAGSLGLALLVAAPPRAAAQLPLADPSSSPTRDGRELQQASQYRAQKVHTVLIAQQEADPDEPGQAPTSRLASYQECDAQGRLLHRYLAGASGHLAQRYDLEYGADGEASSVLISERLPDAADTTRLGQTWLPLSFTRFPPTGGEGYAATWDERTGDWQRSHRFRRWLSHDTTYEATYLVRTGQLNSLRRTYYTGRGQRLRRLDELRYGGPLNDVQRADYYYVRCDASQRELESGLLDFRGLKLTARVGAPAPAEPTAAQLDALARRTQGVPQPLHTYTYDFQGRPQATTSALGTRATYQYDAAGRCVQVQQFRGEELAQRTQHEYLPSGLLARTRVFDRRGRLRSGTTYRYTYFP